MSIKVSFEKVLNQGRLGLGTAQLGNTDHTHDGVKYIKPELAGTILTYASESGIMFFDTGANYGKSEQLVGQLKKQNPDQIPTLQHDPGAISKNACSRSNVYV